MQESEEIVPAAACDVKLGLHDPTLLYNVLFFLFDECLRTYQTFVQQKMLNKHGC